MITEGCIVPEAHRARVAVAVPTDGPCKCEHCEPRRARRATSAPGRRIWRSGTTVRSTARSIDRLTRRLRFRASNICSFAWCGSTSLQRCTGHFSQGRSALDRLSTFGRGDFLATYSRDVGRGAERRWHSPSLLRNTDSCLIETRRGGHKW